MMNYLTNSLPDSCSPGNVKTVVPQWVFYLLSAIYDVIMIMLSSFFLVESSGGVGKCVLPCSSLPPLGIQQSRRMASILKM